MFDNWMDYFLLFAAIGGCLAAILLGCSYLNSIRRMEKLLGALEDGDSTALDIMSETRESRLENQLHQFLSRTLREQERALEEREGVSRLLSDLSHQLKVPLANIVMYTELLQDHGLERDQQRQFAKETGKQAEKMQWLMKSMLKASQLEQGIVAFTAEYCGIKETLGKAVSGVYAQAHKKNISLLIEEFQDRKLFHNSKWTAEALENILDNAVKYSPQGTSIHIRVHPLEIHTRIEIEDEGMGMDREEYNQVFKRFYRGKAASAQEGNGLGLYLAQLILNKEKGYITVTSQKGKGSCFQVYLLNQIVMTDL